MESPSARLAKRILERLVAANLLLSDQVEKLRPKLESGQLTLEDWRLAIEIAMEKGSGK
jgi:hypothetical protein